jgi:DNA-binding protein HU-beta
VKSISQQRTVAARNSVNKIELIERIALEAQVTKAAASTLIESALRHMTAALKKGERVTISGFGTFSTYQRKARNGRNPKTGASIKIASRRVAKFSPGIELKKAVGRKTN